MQRSHAPLTFGVEARERLLCGGDRLVADVFDQFVSGFPCVFGGFPHDHMQSNPELHGAPVARGPLTHIGEFLRHGRRWLAPGQVDIDLFGRQVMGGIGGTAEVQRRIGFLYRRIERLGVLYPQVFTFEIHRFALQHPAPDFQELIGNFVAFAVIEETAVATVLIGVAPRHHIDQEPAIGQSIQGGGHARRNGWRNDPRADRHQVAQAFGQRHQCRSDHPRVFAGAPGRDQHTVVTEAVRRLGHLFQIIKRYRACPLSGAQVMTVAVGRQKPENIHEQILKRFSADGWGARRTTAPRVLPQGGCEPSRAHWLSGNWRNRLRWHTRQSARSRPGRS
ncbi:hypothetical protein D3C76_886080 [compost metagenome]